MLMLDNYKTVLTQRYAKFDGRAGRAEFWWFVLANLLAYVVLFVLTGAADIFAFVLIAYWLATFIPALAVTIRRLHDTNRSGWWYLITLIPFLGILIVIFCASVGNVGPNDYGPLPPPIAS